MSNVNILAVIVAALSSILLGGLWYSNALFGATWRSAAAGPEIQGHPARVFGLSFVFALIAALVYAVLVPLPATAAAAVTQGVLVGAGLVAASFGINYQFANRPTVLWPSTAATTRCNSRSTARSWGCGGRSSEP